MITKTARLIATLATALAMQGTAQAQPQLSGTPDELRGFLFPRPHTVNISGDGELTAYKDLAKVSLLVTTEARDLSRVHDGQSGTAHCFDSRLHQCRYSRQ
jgi:uncharacterized protein YggE